MISLPVRIEVKNADSAVLQLRTASYSDSGKVLQLTSYSSSHDSSVYNYTYDHFGNANTYRLPENESGQRLQFAYQYDTIVRTYPVRIDNVSLNYHSTAEYDYRYGKPIQTVDVNGNEIRYKYDFMGRTSVIIAPYETDMGRPYTIKMTYIPKNYNKLDIFTPNTWRNYACSFHYDPEHPDYDLRTVVLSDGLGRHLQTKKDAEIDGQVKCLVTGRVEYDCFGRTVAQFHPFTEDLGTENVYNDSVTTGTATIIRYDILDRQTYIRTPMNLVTTMTYGFDTCGGHQCLRTSVTDPMSNTIHTLVGTIGQQLKQIAPSNTVTRFEYDALGRLLRSIDPDNISTFYTYDMLGRLVQRIHPDAGTDRYHYDAAGNMTSHVNALADSVIYRYNYNQLTDVEFPRYPANNVHYLYGNAASANVNGVGKVIGQVDATGWQKFKYGKLGELIENNRTFALLFDNQTYTFKMQYQYDSYNRIQAITYPDGEVVGYDYGRGGMLKRVTGDKNGVHYTYIDSIKYNEFELKDTMWYGNGTWACYEYDTLLRLSRLRSYEGHDSLMQDIAYTYDSVGNITRLQNDAGILNVCFGGAYKCTYAYDALYRLASAHGEWYGSQPRQYDVVMSYLNNGRINSKSVEIADTAGAVQSQNSYVYSYPTNSNKLASIIQNPPQAFVWDATGNLVYHRKIYLARSLCWDEQNRLLGVNDESQHISCYQYDANGDRTYKLTGTCDLLSINGHLEYFYQMDNATLYASPYLVATQQGYTKHYYAENERIASRIGGGGLQDMNLPHCSPSMIAEKISANRMMYNGLIQNCLNVDYYEEKSSLRRLYDWCDSVQPEEDCYWYHPDHLGSSSWITDSADHPIQHLHYLPWGEDFVNQKQSGFDGVRFTFSAKEKDSETGLSYFGSRYYSSDLSIWLSVDPMSDKYAYQSGYVYCGNNPIKVVDPNGEDEWEVNQSGYIRHIKNDKPDRLYAVYGFGKERWGKRKSDVEPLDVDKSIMKTMSDFGKYTTFSADNKREKMDDLFNFLADNTDVEWTQLSIHDQYENEYDFLSTSHENINSDLPLRYEIMVYAKAEEGTLDAFKHSHPDRYTGFNYYYKIIYPYTCHIPSEGDRKTKENILKKCGSDKIQPRFILRNGGHSNGY